MIVVHHLGGLVRRANPEPAAQPLSAADHRQRADLRQAGMTLRDGGDRRLLHGFCTTIPRRASLLSLAYWGELLALARPGDPGRLHHDHAVGRHPLRGGQDQAVSDTDDLTGLYNMRAFSAMLQRAFKQSRALWASAVRS